MGRPREYEMGYDRRAAWKERNNFEKGDYRRGYRAGRDRGSKGKPIPDLSDRASEYQVGYLKGYASISL